MMGLYADFMLSSRELQMTTDFLRDDRFNFYSAREAMVLTTAPYVREKDAERFDKAIFEAFSALCGDHPEEQWKEAERVLREAIDPDAPTKRFRPRRVRSIMKVSLAFASPRLAQHKSFSAMAKRSGYSFLGRH